MYVYQLGCTGEHVSMFVYLRTLTKREVILSDVLYLLDTVWIIRMA